MCQCFKNVATLTPLSLQANIVPKKSIEKPHYKRHRTKKPTEFHSPTPTIHKTLQSKMSFSKTSILRNDPETKHVFPLPSLISFKRDKNISNFLVRSAFKSDNQPEAFKCTRTRRKTCPFISNMVKISGPNPSAKITDYVLYMHIRKCHILHNLHTKQEDLHRRNMEKIGRPLSRTPTRCRN